MDHSQNSLRVGAAAILCAVILRLGIGPLSGGIQQLLRNPTVLSFLIYAETGRHIRFIDPTEPTLTSTGESPAPFFLPQKAEPLTFSSSDAQLLEIRYQTTRRPDVEALLTQPLEWTLKGTEPTVLILHTHATESYTKGSERYTETAAYRTLDEGYNMISIGDALTEALEKAGIPVIHDCSIHDYPSYNGSYSLSRKTISQHLEQNPSIRLILDLHRDASEDIGNQLCPVANINGQTAAQLMLVMGMAHAGSDENLALGLKLHAALSRIAPGIMRPINLRESRFNQDLSPGALLVEVGAAGNSREQAVLAAQILAEGIIALADGSKFSEK